MFGMEYISNYKRGRGVVSMGYYRKPYFASPMVTWPQKVKVMTPKYLRLHISVTMQDRHMVIMDQLLHTASEIMWPQKVKVAAGIVRQWDKHLIPQNVYLVAFKINELRLQKLNLMQWQILLFHHFTTVSPTQSLISYLSFTDPTLLCIPPCL